MCRDGKRIFISYVWILYLNFVITFYIKEKAFEQKQISKHYCVFPPFVSIPRSNDGVVRNLFTFVIFESSIARVCARLMLNIDLRLILKEKLYIVEIKVYKQ